MSQNTLPGPKTKKTTKPIALAYDNNNHLITAHVSCGTVSISLCLSFCSSSNVRECSRTICDVTVCTAHNVSHETLKKNSHRNGMTVKAAKGFMPIFYATEELQSNFDLYTTIPTINIPSLLSVEKKNPTNLYNQPL